MADDVYGISASIDASEITKGRDEIISAINDIEKAIESSASNGQDKWSQLDKALSNSSTDMAAAMQRNAKAIEEFKDRFDRIGANIPSGEFDKFAAEVGSAMNNANNYIKAVEDRLQLQKNAVLTLIDNLNKYESSGLISKGQMNSLASEANQVLDAIKGQRNQLEAQKSALKDVETMWASINAERKNAEFNSASNDELEKQRELLQQIFSVFAQSGPEAAAAFVSAMGVGTNEIEGLLSKITERIYETKQDIKSAESDLKKGLGSNNYLDSGMSTAQVIGESKKNLDDLTTQYNALKSVMDSMATSAKQIAVDPSSLDLFKSRMADIVEMLQTKGPTAAKALANAIGLSDEQIQSLRVSIGSTLATMEGRAATMGVAASAQGASGGTGDSAAQKAAIQDMQAQVSVLNALEEEGNQKRVRARTIIMELREKMMLLNEAGASGTQEYVRLGEQMGKMRANMNKVNAQMQYFANPNKKLLLTKTALQGVSSMASLCVGTLGLFNTKEEDMIKIQTTVQSLLGITAGLEGTYNAIKKSSVLMTGIMVLQTRAEAAAHTLNAAMINGEKEATIANTVALKAFNLVAKANPYVLLATAIGVVVAAIVAFTAHTKASTEAQKQQEEQAKRLAEISNGSQESIGNEVGNTMSKFKELQARYNALGDDMKAKEKFIKDNKAAFEALGIGVYSVVDAEKVFVKNTDAVVAALIARAKAEAMYKRIGELETEKIKQYNERDKSDESYKTYKAGDTMYAGAAHTYNLKGNGEDYTFAGAAGIRLTERGARKVTNENKSYSDSKKNNKRKQIEAPINQEINELETAVKKQQKDANEKLKALNLPINNAGTTQTMRNNNSTSTSNNEDKEEYERQMREYTELIRKMYDERKKAEREMQLDYEQSVIDVMNDGAAKRLKQNELNYKKEFNQIAQERKELRDKKIDNAKQLFESNPDNKDMFFDENTVDISETADEQKYFTQKLAAIAQNKYKSDKEIKDALKEQETSDKLNYLNSQDDYDSKYEALNLKKQQDLDKINKDTSLSAESKKYQTAVVEKNYTKDKAKLDFESLKDGISWDTVFENIEGIDTSRLDEINTQLKNFLENVKEPDQAKTIADAMQKIANIKINRNPFKALSESAKDMAAAKKALKAAQDSGDASAQAEAEDKLTKAQQRHKKATKAVVEVSKQFAAALNEVGQLVGGTTGKFISLSASAVSAGSALLESIKAVQSGAQGLERAVAVLAIIEAALQVINAMLSFFLSGPDATLTQYVDAMNTYTTSLKQSISDLNEEIENSHNTILQIISDYDKLIAKYQEANKVVKSQATVWLNSGASATSHSEGYKIGKSFADGLKSSNSEVRKFYQDAFNQLSYYYTQATGKIATSVSDFERFDWLFQLPDEMLKALAQNSTIMAVLGDTLSNYIQTYVSNIKSATDAIDEMNEKILGISFDDFYSDFSEMVTDLTKSTKDMTNDISKIIRDALIKDLIANAYKDKIQELYDSALNLAHNHDNMSDEEFQKGISDLRKGYSSVGKEIQNSVKILDTITGYDEDWADQSANTGAFETMSEDTAQELNGRFAALQESNEAIRQNSVIMLEQMEGQTVNVDSIRGYVSEIADVQRNTASNVADIAKMSMLYMPYLYDIKENTKKLLKTV